MLTNQGMSEHARLLGMLTTEDEVRGLLTVYRDFLYPNQRFKTMTATRQAEGDLDQSQMVRDMGEIHQEVLAIVARAGALIPRFDRYGLPLTLRFDEFRCGDTAALVTPVADSYHDIWMELHEDLLVTLGHSR